MNGCLWVYSKLVRYKATVYIRKGTTGNSNEMTYQGRLIQNASI